jgi:hypothetical protein
MSQPRTRTVDCQVQSVPALAEGLVDLGPLPLRSRVKLALKRALDAPTKRKLKRLTNRLRNAGSGTAEPARQNVQTAKLQPGNLVRVRRREEIEATLDSWQELKGCAVMEDMWQYCGTTQRVFKRVERFVDERDYRVKRASGLVLLENIFCQGTTVYGRCDRSCFFFWREEWLEKVE